MYIQHDDLNFIIPFQVEGVRCAFQDNSEGLSQFLSQQLDNQCKDPDPDKFKQALFRVSAFLVTSTGKILLTQLHSFKTTSYILIMIVTIQRVYNLPINLCCRCESPAITFLVLGAHQTLY